MFHWGPAPPKWLKITALVSALAEFTIIMFWGSLDCENSVISMLGIKFVLRLFT